MQDTIKTLSTLNNLSVPFIPEFLYGNEKVIVTKWCCGPVEDFRRLS